MKTPSSSTPLAALAAIAIALSTPAVRAQIFYDVNDAVAGFGSYDGTTWSSSNTNWTTNSAGTSTTVTWSGAGGASATTTFDTTGQGSSTKNIEVDSDFALSGLTKLGNRAVALNNGSGGTQTITMSGGIVSVSDASISVNNNITFTGNFTKQGTNTLTLGVIGTASAYVGTMTIEAGTVGFNDERLTSSSNVTLSGGNLILASNGNGIIGNLSGNSGSVGMSNGNNRNITITQTTDANFGGVLAEHQVLANTLSFIKAGNARLTLSGANTFDGTMSINDGTIVAASNGALSTTATTVGANGNLQINNGISLTASGITLSATTSRLTVGTTAATGSATIAALSTTAAGADFAFDLNGTGAVDLLSVSGAANFSGDALTFSFTDLGGTSFLANTWYTIITAGTLTGPTSVTAVDPAGWSGFNWQVSGNDLQIQYATVIPEPTTWLLLGASLVWLTLIRRRRRLC